MHEETPVYDSRRRRPRLWEELEEIRERRDFVRVLVLSQLKTKYKRSALGLLWSLLNPLLTMLVMTVAFSQLFHRALPGYPAYVLSGLLLWQLFSGATSQAMNSLVWGGALLTRVHIPASSLCLAAISTGIINLLLSLAGLAAVMIIVDQPFRISLLFLPVPLALSAAFTLGTALLLSTVAVFFTDVAHLWSVVLRAWFYLTPIMYPETILPTAIRSLLPLNPFYSLLLCWRIPIYEGTVPPLHTLLVAAAWALGTLVVGWVVFTRKSHEFAYRV